MFREFMLDKGFKENYDKVRLDYSYYKIYYPDPPCQTNEHIAIFVRNRSGQCTVEILAKTNSGDLIEMKFYSLSEGDIIRNLDSCAQRLFRALKDIQENS